MATLQGVKLALESCPELRLVFGSAVRGEERPRSDLDVAILLDGEPDLEAILHLGMDLEESRGRRVDLVDLGTAPPLLAHEVISRGKLLMCRDEDERVAFHARTVTRYLDTAHLRKIQHAYLRERADARRARSA